MLYQQLSGRRKIDENQKGREREEKENVSYRHVHVASHVWSNRQPKPDPRMPPSYSAVAGRGGVKEKEGAKDADKNEKEGTKDTDKNEEKGAKDADKNEKEGAKDADKNEEEEEERWFRKDVFHF